MNQNLRVNKISIWKASHQDSLWNRGERQLGNRLMPLGRHSRLVTHSFLPTNEDCVTSQRNVCRRRSKACWCDKNISEPDKTRICTKELDLFKGQQQRVPLTESKTNVVNPFTTKGEFDKKKTSVKRDLTVWPLKWKLSITTFYWWCSHCCWTQFLVLQLLCSIWTENTAVKGLKAYHKIHTQYCKTLGPITFTK